MHKIFMPMGFAIKRGVLGVTTGVKTQVAPRCETALSSGACIDRNAVKCQIAHAGSEGLQASDGIHNSACSLQDPRPNLSCAVSSHEVSVFLDYSGNHVSITSCQKL